MTSWSVLEGDALDRLRELPDRHVQTCITSPPYFGLRDYGTGEWEGGDDGCDHSRHVDYGETSDTNRGSIRGGPMDKCGARRIDRQVGLEQTPDEYVARLVEVFREVRRVLRDDGTLWLNLGDSYCNVPSGNHSSQRDRPPQDGSFRVPNFATREQQWIDRGRSDKLRLEGVKQKDLLGIPWAVAFALRADGWYLRSDIIWAKPNPMPESVTDRPTKSHEYLFLLSKGPRYYFDADAIREQDSGRPSGNGFVRDHRLTYQNADGTGRGTEDEWEPGGGRNKRSVWTVATQPFPGAHFAVFPPKLIEPCVLAGSSDRACGVCGAPWERVTKPTLEAMLRSERPQQRRAAELAREGGLTDEHLAAVRATGSADVGQARATQNGVNAEATAALAAEAKTVLGGYFREFNGPELATVGWQPTCDHQDDTAASVVLDPFNGAGTTGLVAAMHGRGYIGIELNPTYAQMARERIAAAERVGFRSLERGPEPIEGQTSIFDVLE